ncbi:MAG: hypothetical protein ACRDN1_07380 [Trebonia sp.]
MQRGAAVIAAAGVEGKPRSAIRRTASVSPRSAASSIAPRSSSVSLSTSPGSSAISCRAPAWSRRRHADRKRSAAVASS